MRKIIAAGAVVIALAACSGSPSAVALTPSPAAATAAASPTTASPVPTLPLTASDLTGSVTITGAINDRFPYTTPPRCWMYPVNGTYDQAVAVYFNLGTADDTVQLMMRGWHGTGTYVVDSFGNGNYVDYNNAGNHSSSTDGSIQVLKANRSIVEGTVDANLRVTVATATSTRLAQAHVTGTWACIPQ
jgi:hypothetical protein